MKKARSKMVKWLFLLTLILGSAGMSLGSEEVIAGIEAEAVEVVNGHDKLNAWEKVKHLKPEIKLNPSILDELTQLSAKTIDDIPLDIKKLIDNGFDNVIKNLDEAEILARLKQMNQWEPKWVNDLANKFGKPKYVGLVDDLTDPQLFKLYNDIALDPLNARDLVKHLDISDGIFNKVGKSVFFQEVTTLGKNFEKFIEGNLSILRTKILKKYKDLDINDYEIFTQVQLKTGVGTEYFVADMVLVRRIVDDFGQPLLDKSKVIVIESKLSIGTNLTIPQGNALSKVKSSLNTFDIRSVSKQNVNGFTITNSDNLKINGFIKAYSDGSGNIINDVVSL